MHLAGKFDLSETQKYQTQIIPGNYTEESIQRVAKAIDIAKILREKLNPEFTDR